ncbi:hypothetical protein FZC80_16220 [Rossellomorea aquimaris]|uniref:Uncharacterized protein n=1 Tax=Rossellomorea aquimaris TaxID=189382 RepID=A0A5D4TMY5_9BACI|nr:hypothetical protein FZC80_16220 [Rossellomorea aquimaris]
MILSLVAGSFFMYSKRKATK